MYTIKLTQIAAEFITKLDGKSQQQIMEKIEVLKEYPLKVEKPLKGNLQDYRSIRSVGQRYRIIYQVKETEVEVIVVAVGIKRDGDKKNDIYELMKKLCGLLGVPYFFDIAIHQVPPYVPIRKPFERRHLLMMLF